MKKRRTFLGVHRDYKIWWVSQAVDTVRIKSGQECPAPPMAFALLLLGRYFDEKPGLADVAEVCSEEEGGEGAPNEIEKECVLDISPGTG